MTQVQIEKKTGIKHGHISDIESNKYPNPGIYTILKVAQALNVSIEELLGLKSKGRITPLPVISKVVGSPEGDYFTDQDFPVGAGEDYYQVDDENAFVLSVVGDSMEPAVRAGDQVIITPNKKCKSGSICIVRLAESGKTFLKRVEFLGDTVILKSDNPRYDTMVYKQQEIGFCYRVEAILPR